MLFVVAACARATDVRDHLYYPQTFDVVHKILVVPFENLTPFPEAGLIVADQVADELRAWQGYEVLDRHAVEGRARRGELTLPLHWGRAEAIAFGRELEADVVAYGTVVEFGYLREHRGVTELATFAVTMRLVNSQSGRVVWNGTMLGTAGSDLTPGRPPLMEVSNRVIGSALAQMFEAYEDYRSLVAKERRAGAARTEAGAPAPTPVLDRFTTEPAVETTVAPAEPAPERAPRSDFDDILSGESSVLDIGDGPGRSGRANDADLLDTTEPVGPVDEPAP